MRAIELSHTTHLQHVHTVERIGTGIIGKEITAEQAVLFGERVIHFANSLMLVVVRQDAVLQPAARVCWRWHVFQEVQRLRADI